VRSDVDWSEDCTNCTDALMRRGTGGDGALLDKRPRPRDRLKMTRYQIHISISSSTLVT
jgi:hypothetical protein